MKKVAFLISSLDLGGAQRAVSSITTLLGDNVDIDIILNNSDDIVYPYRGRIISLNIKNNDDRTNILFQIKVFIKRIKLLKKLKRSREYDAVISFLDSANVANIVTGNKYCKSIISVRVNLSEDKNWKYKIIVNNLARLLYNKADVIVSLSEGVKEDLVSNFNIDKDKVVTIYNGYDTDDIVNKAKDSTDIEVDKSYINIATMGRLVSQKGQWHIIRAFAELYKKNKNIRLYILGVGPLKEYFERIIKDYGLGEVIYLTGFVDNSYALLSRMDIFVFTSIFEGFGNALVEAMTLGLACISTDYKSGAKEILSNDISKCINEVTYDEYGILIPNLSARQLEASEPLDETELKLLDAMSAMVEKDELRDYYSKMAKERAEYFSLERAVYEWEKII